MGTLLYDSSASLKFDDRVLSHLQIVIGSKLRRGESFYFSWVDRPEDGSGRWALWMHPTISLAYHYSGSSVPSINRAWLEELVLSANTAGGLHLTHEPADIADSARVEHLQAH